VAITTVTKADGTAQPYERYKVMRTLRNYGISEEQAASAVEEIEERLYERMRTRDVLKLIRSVGRKYQPAVAERTNVRRAIGMLRPKPDFELYVRALLAGCGYEVGEGRILRGRCGEHEVDAVACKDGITYFVEVKHHHNHHRMTGLDEGRIARAIVEDVQEGYKEGRNHFTVDKAMIVSNTKLSDHAKRYATCWDIKHIGWDHPAEENIARMVADPTLVPVTLIKGVNARMRDRLVAAKIVTVGQLLEHSPGELADMTGEAEGDMVVLVKRAGKVVDG